MQQKCIGFDVLLLQETWLSSDTSYKLDDISSDIIILHSSNMKSKNQIFWVDHLEALPYCTTNIYLLQYTLLLQTHLDVLV